MLYEEGSNPLTLEEEQVLLRDYKNTSNGEALEKLIIFCFPTIINQAYKFSSFDVDFNDLLQEGLIGLLHAIKKFDVNRGVRLLSYARLVIRHKMMVHTAKFHISVDLSPAVRMPSHEGDNFKNMNLLRNVPMGEIEHRKSVSDPEDSYYKKELLTIVLDLIDKCLNDTQKMVISRRILSDNPDTLSEIGEDISRTAECVRQIESRSFKIIKDRIRTIKDLRSLVIGE